MVDGEKQIINAETIPVLDKYEFSKPEVVDLQTQLDLENKLIPFPRELPARSLFKEGGESVAKLDKIVDRYLDDMKLETNGSATKLRSFADILKYAIHLTWRVTGEHNSDVEIEEASKHADYDNPPPTKCNIFNELFTQFVPLLAKKLERPELMSKYKLSTVSADWATDIVEETAYGASYGAVYHAHVVMISHDGDRYYASILDPYHTSDPDNKAKMSPEELYSELDFTEKRAASSLIDFLMVMNNTKIYSDIVDSNFLALLASAVKQRPDDFKPAMFDPLLKLAKYKLELIRNRLPYLPNQLIIKLEGQTSQVRPYRSKYSQDNSITPGEAVRSKPPANYAEVRETNKLKAEVALTEIYIRQLEELQASLAKKD